MSTSLVVFSNTPEGLCVTYGTMESLNASDSSYKNCHLYCHHPCYPTIPSYEGKYAMRFILVVPASDQACQQVVPYKGIKFPTKFHRYKDPSKEKYEQSVQILQLSQNGPPGSQD